MVCTAGSTVTYKVVTAASLFGLDVVFMAGSTVIYEVVTATSLFALDWCVYGRFYCNI